MTIDGMKVWLVSESSPATSEEAAERLSIWLSAFVPRDPMARFSPRSVAVALRSCGLPQGRPGAVTHVLRLGPMAGAAFTSAVASLRVGSAERATDAGLELRLIVGDPIPVVEARFRKAVSMQATTGGWLGHDADRVDDLNVISFCSTAPTRRLPLGATCEPLGHGFLLRSIGSFEDAAAMTSSVKALAIALRQPEPERSPVHAHMTPAPEPLQPPRVELAPVIVAPVPPAAISEPNLDETLPITGPVRLSGELPFSGSTGDETLQALFRSPSPAELAPSTGSGPPTDETVMLPPNAGASAASAGAGRTGLSVPVMTLERYAELRAHLLVFGEDHAATLQHFGLRSHQDRELLKLRFASIFTSDEARRDRFVARMQVIAAQLRAAGKKPT